MCAEAGPTRRVRGRAPAAGGLWFVFLFLFATQLGAATLLVPTDRELAASSKAIVITTAGESRGVINAAGAIETRTTMHVATRVKGAIADTFELAEPGGRVGEIGLAIAGSPRFANGERLLLMLMPRADGTWTSRILGAGVFRYEGTALVRHDVCGFDANGATHVEPRRNAEKFVRFVESGDASIDYVEAPAPRPRLAANAAPPIGSYLIQEGGRGLRWSTFPSAVVFRSNGAQSGTPDGGLGAARRGLAAWTDDGGSNIIYQYGGTTAASGGLMRTDGVNSMLFNDANGEIGGAFPTDNILAIGGAWYRGQTHAFGGETFNTIIEADLVVQNGIFGAGLTGLGFDHVIAHELGHTLGFRHSDDPPADGTRSTQALMNSTVNFNNDTIGATLLAWDREAAAAVYGSGIPACTPPAITQHPKSIELTTPSAVTLTVTATGDAPLAYQWFIGQRGNTNTPIAGATSASVTVTPTATTNYWVRISNGCAPAAGSNVATVTIAGCPAVIFATQSDSAAILQSKSASIFANASGGSGITYQWYEGPSGTTNRPIANATSSGLIVAPLATTSYWVRATNSCGAFADSAAIVVTVTPCNAPRVVIEPAGGEAASGDVVTIFADVEGTEPMSLQWYEGAKGDTSQPVTNGHGESFTTQPLLAPASFWLHAENECGSSDSEAATFAIVPHCDPPLLTDHPANAVVSPGATARLTAGVTGTSLSYRWYQGSAFDFTKPVGGSSPILITPPILAPMEFWVVITNGCGSTNSETITVAPAAIKRRASGH